MPQKSHNTIFGDQGTAPERTEEKDKLPRRRKGAGDDLPVNDTEPGGISGRPDRPSSADDLKNPRTGPVG